MPVKKTNAARVLDGLGIPYELAEFTPDLEDLSAVRAAQELNADPETVFKTLVVRTTPGGIWMTCIPAAAELNLKRVAAVTGNKSAEMVPLKEVLPLTGYMRGGCSPVGGKKNYPVVIHETAQLYDRIYVSAGKRGLQFILKPEDLAKAVDGFFADICQG